jgi:hypothetical protein
MTPIQIFFLMLFGSLIIYGLIRPFQSMYARLFLITGAILGFISVLGKEYTNAMADILGVSHGSYLYLYLGLITTFLFIFFTLNNFSLQQKLISKLTREIAILESKIKENNPH